MDTTFGAVPIEGGVRFRVWVPRAPAVELVIHTGPSAGTYRTVGDGDGLCEVVVPGARAGDRYSYSLDGHLRPDPASRFQPEGVHGPSEIVASDRFEWTDGSWTGRAASDLVIYEMHVGTFSPKGTFEGAAERLPYLRDLGITALELMPVADFAGSRNWGYDGVCLYAPSRAYGTPDDLRRLVDAAHAAGIAVLLDVVYNHLGPEGAYLGAFAPDYFTDRYPTPWGPAINLDGPRSAMVRRFIMDNAAHWIREYHLDGLRLDATDALKDTSTPTIVQELTAAARAAARHPVTIFAEDSRNMGAIVAGVEEGGWGVDGIWAEDFHHIVRRLVAGDEHGYYMDYAGTTDEIARTIRQGWFYTGEWSAFRKRMRGTDASTTALRRVVVCLQNHDLIGNRATGDRLHHRIAPEVWRAASTLLLAVPMTPLIFMGQEWAAASPFQFFTDLEPWLGSMVTEGRRHEYASWPEFSSPDARTRIPDPQARSTFDASRLDWTEIDRPAHARVLALYRALIAMRRAHAGLGASDGTTCAATAVDADTIVMERPSDVAVYWVVARLRHHGVVDLAGLAGQAAAGGDGRWDVLLTTEEPRFAADPSPLDIDRSAGTPVVRFTRPGAVVLRRSRLDR